MRNLILIMAFSGLLIHAKAATSYVSLSGNDDNPGTIDQPWLSIQKGFNQLTAGDTLYIREGTYTPSGTAMAGMISGASATGRKGTATKLFYVFAMPGERVVIDCRAMSAAPGLHAGILLAGCDYWYIRGLEITGVAQYQGPLVFRAMGLVIQNGNNNRIENVSAHNIGGPGFELRDASEGNLLLNCDSYNNFDPGSQTPGDDADGFDIGFIAARQGSERVNTLSGCRAWSNADDGFDMFQQKGYHGVYILRNCWAWKNGYRPDGKTPAGDGNGFKLGADNAFPLDFTVRRTLTNCVAVSNRQRGFSQEAARVLMLFYNNSAYRNGSWGFSFFQYDLPDILKNNLSYRNPDGTIENQGINRKHDHNSWDSKVLVTDADFASLDITELAKPRKADGSLPDIIFLHPVKGSDLTDAGTDVGLPFSGKAPDIGAFEAVTK
jgi:hypothetical protein